MADVHEIAEGIFRIASYNEQAGLAFTQFLIRDEQPLLFHTGQRGIFQDTLAAVRTLIEPATLRYVSWSHWEGDESGALNDFLGVAPAAEPVHGALGARLNVKEWAIRPARIVADGEVLPLGSHRLRFLMTPQVPHAWDALMAYEETTGTLFVSDLFVQFGDRTRATSTDIVGPSIDSFRRIPEAYPVGPRMIATFDRLLATRPRTLAVMHGPTYTGDAAAAALRDLRDGMVAATDWSGLRDASSGMLVV